MGESNLTASQEVIEAEGEFLFDAMSEFRKILYKRSFEKIPSEIIVFTQLSLGILGSQFRFMSAGTMIDVPIDKTTERKLAVVFSVARGALHLRDAVYSGNYVQAAALLRQEIEALLVQVELNRGKRIDKKTPNVAATKMFNRRYGQLCEYVHMSDHSKLVSALGGKSLKFDPELDLKMAVEFLGIHSALLVAQSMFLGSVLAEFRDEQLTAAERDCGAMVLGSLINHGVFSEHELITLNAKFS